MTKLLCLTLFAGSALAASGANEKFDVLIKNGTVYDGSGGAGKKPMSPSAAIASSA